MTEAADAPAQTAATTFRRNLKRERLRQAKTMRGLAREAGMHASEISRLEKGERDPRLSIMIRIARALDVSLVDLVRAEGW